MSCDCENYQGPCREELPYPIVSAESVPSLISNLAYALYGATRKSVVNGSIVWNILCDPNLTAQITGLPRNAGEGLLCYFIRCFNLIVSNAFLIQPGSIDPTKLTTGGPSWNPSGDLTIGRNLNVTGTANIANITGNAATATLATAATNIAGGATGSLPYQSAAGTTSLLATTGASANWVLALSSGLLPSWKQASVAATGSTFALRDSGGGLTASQFNGNASTATALQNTRTISLAGAVTGSVTDNSGNLSIVTTLAANTPGVAAARFAFNAAPTPIASCTIYSGGTNVAAVQTPSAHGRSVGDFVTIFSVAPSLALGIFTITAVPDSTHLSFAITGNISGSTSGVTIYPYASIYNPNNLRAGPLNGASGAGATGLYTIQGSAILSTSVVLGSAGGLAGASPGGTLGINSAPISSSVSVGVTSATGTATDYPFVCIAIF